MSRVPRSSARGSGVDAKALTIRCGDQITALIVAFGRGGFAKITAYATQNDWTCRDLKRSFERLRQTERGCRLPLDRNAVRMIEIRPR